MRHNYTYTRFFKTEDEFSQFQQILRSRQRLAASHFNEWVLCRLIGPLRQKISDLAVLQTVEQPSVAKSLSIILILKLTTKPRMKMDG
jgi:hypothetical protein